MSTTSTVTKSDKADVQDKRRHKYNYSFKTKRKLGVHATSGLCRNTSLNSSVMKRTLTSNNRALARALELKKTELATAINHITKLRSENHSLQSEVIRLRAGTGNTVEEFERAVDARVKLTLEIVWKSVQKIGSNMQSTVEEIGNLMSIISRGGEQGLISSGSLAAATRTSTSETKERTSAQLHAPVAGASATNNSQTSLPAATASLPATANRCRANRVPVSAVAIDDDSSECEDDSSNAAAEPGRPTDTDDFVTSQSIAFHGGIGNLSMIMEQSCIDVDVSICDSDMGPCTRSDRRNAIVFQRSNEDDEELDQPDEVPAVLSTERISRSRSRRRSVATDGGVVHDLDDTNERTLTPGNGQAPKPGNDQLLLSGNAPDTHRMSYESEHPTVICVKDDYSAKAESQQEGEVAPPNDETPATNTKRDVEHRSSLTRRDIPTFVPLDNKSTNSPVVAGFSKKLKTAACGSKPSRSRDKLDSKAKKLRQEKSSSLEIIDPKLNSRRQTFVVDKGNGATTVEVTSQQAVSQSDAASTVNTRERRRHFSGAADNSEMPWVDYNMGVEEDIMNQNDDVLQDISGCQSVESVASPCSKMETREAGSPSKLQVPVTVSSSSSSSVCGNVEPAAGAVTIISVEDMEITAVLSTVIQITSETASEAAAAASPEKSVAANVEVSRNIDKKYNSVPDSDGDLETRKATKSQKTSKKKPGSKEDRDISTRNLPPVGKTGRSSGRASTAVPVDKPEANCIQDEPSCDAVFVESETAERNGVGVAKRSSSASSMGGHRLSKGIGQKPAVPDVPATRSDDTDDGTKGKKIISVYLAKPGKMVFNAEHAGSVVSQSTAAAVGNKTSRSKSRSTLPLQTKPRSKQSRATLEVADSNPYSVFQYDGTPKEEISGRRRATSKPEPLKVVEDSSSAVAADLPRLASLHGTPHSSVTDEDDISNSPHGIMVVLANGRRTKPRQVQGKSVRYVDTTEHESKVVRIPTPGRSNSSLAGGDAAAAATVNVAATPDYIRQTSARLWNSSPDVTDESLVTRGLDLDVNAVPDSPMTVGDESERDVTVEGRHDAKQTENVSSVSAGRGEDIILTSSESVVFGSRSVVGSKKSETKDVDGHRRVNQNHSSKRQEEERNGSSKSLEKKNDSSKNQVERIDSSENRADRSDSSKSQEERERRSKLLFGDIEESLVEDNEKVADAAAADSNGRQPAEFVQTGGENPDATGAGIAAVESAQHVSRKADRKVGKSLELKRKKPKHTAASASAGGATSDHDDDDFRSPKRKQKSPEAAVEARVSVVAETVADKRVVENTEDQNVEPARVHDEQRNMEEMIAVAENQNRRSKSTGLQLAHLPPRLSEDPSNAEGHRSRRTASCVSYKEPSLGSKLRQGDHFTSTIYKDAKSAKHNEKVFVSQRDSIYSTSEQQQQQQLSRRSSARQPLLTSAQHGV